MSLEDLNKKRRRWVEANRENGFEEGIKNLLTDLYPDNAHFIYELLQNAEDAGAAMVRFVLGRDSLEFEHDGPRLFQLKDVDSITSIGTSTKRNDPTAIGKFGVGFKAVFAYTSMPEVHSGDYHFRIRDMVVPERAATPSCFNSESGTHFRFPFDHPSKGRQHACEEIESALLQLDDSTLLFLNHIHTIEYLLPNGKLGKVERIPRDGGRVEIRSTSLDAVASTSQWLRFTSDVDIKDEHGKEKTCRIAIAYSLIPKKERQGNSEEWEVVPLERGQVSIYFPATKEASGLFFHIHAPFASTVARDSVRDVPANHRLIERVAQLTADSLTEVKEQGLLTVGFLAVLPNLQDGIPRFYEPIRKRIVSAFQTRELLPTRNKSHAAADALLRGPSRISDVLDDDDMSFLTDSEPPFWAANPPQINQREDRFLDSLEIDEWGWHELGEKFYRPPLFGVHEIEEWFVKKSDSWMARFYALLGEAVESHGRTFNLGRLQLVRVEAENKGVANVVPQEAFFAPQEGEGSARRGIHFVKNSMLETLRSELRKRLARVFLEHVGVKPFDEKALLELRLADYQEGCVEPGSKHVEDVKRILRCWKKDESIEEIFDGVPFLLGRHEDGEDIWLAPEELCLDEPYQRSGLAEHFDIHERYPLSPTYSKSLTDSNLRQFVDFLRAIGVQDELEVIEVGIWRNPARAELMADKYRQGARTTNSEIDEDYTIDKVDEYVGSETVSASRLIWSALTKADRNIAMARYRPNQNYSIKEAPSQLVTFLATVAWIPDKDGEFRVPKSMVAQDLRADFPHDDRNGLLSAIGFGRDELQRSKAYKEKDWLIKKVGFNSPEEAEEIATLFKESGLTVAEIRSRIAPRERVALPENAVPNPERRRLNVMEQGVGAPDRKAVKRERSLFEDGAEEVAMARAYLRPMYTNPDGQLVCQCCLQEMPFKVNGLHYFEAVKVVRCLDKHLHQSRLALCPTCAAMYKYARDTEDEEIICQIRGKSGEAGFSSTKLDVVLAGLHRNLRFVGKHLLDLETLLCGSDEVG